MSDVNAMTNVILMLARWGLEREQRLREVEEAGKLAGTTASPTDDDDYTAVEVSIPQALMPAMGNNAVSPRR